MSVEGPPEDELVSDTGRLSDADPGSRSELRDSVIPRETCEASWVNKRGRYGGQGQSCGASG